MAERSKALVLGTSLLGGVGSNPTAARNIHNTIKFILSMELAELQIFKRATPLSPLTYQMNSQLAGFKPAIASGNSSPLIFLDIQGFVFQVV